MYNKGDMVMSLTNYAVLTKVRSYEQNFWRPEITFFDIKNVVVEIKVEVVDL